MNLINLFPLTIIKDKIDILDDEKKLMIDEIRSMKKNSKNINYQTKSNAWTGDTQGFEFIHKNNKFKNLFNEITKRNLFTFSFNKSNLLYIWPNFKDLN